MIYLTHDGSHHTVEKKWGKEEWIVNTDEYCGKILTCNKGRWSSEGKFHKHNIKDETFYILKGKLILEYITPEDITWTTIVLNTGDSFRLTPEVWHRFKEFDYCCQFAEFSTKHRESDSIRKSYSEIMKGE